MRRIKLVISYDGIGYSGWQVQTKTDNTISEKIILALYDLLHERVHLIGSGRTDAGVSAYGQVAHFDTNNSNIKPEDFARALNVRLPEDIRIISSREENLDFHAQHSAKKKTYKYFFYTNSNPNAYLDKFAAFVPYENISLEKLNLCAKLFVGTHNYKAFSSTGSNVKGTIREVYDSRVEKIGDVYCFTVTANGFLYNMVRIMVGTIIDVARGKININNIEKAFVTGDRSLLGQTASAKGLVLQSVEYV